MSTRNHFFDRQTCIKVDPNAEYNQEDKETLLVFLNGTERESVWTTSTDPRPSIIAMGMREIVSARRERNAESTSLVASRQNFTAFVSFLGTPSPL